MDIQNEDNVQHAYCDTFIKQTVVINSLRPVTHICISNVTIIVSDNDLVPGQHQAIIWTSAGILLIEHLWTNFSGI